jgi:hypothetical protein
MQFQRFGRIVTGRACPTRSIAPQELLAGRVINRVNR